MPGPLLARSHCRGAGRCRGTLAGHCGTTARRRRAGGPDRPLGGIRLIAPPRMVLSPLHGGASEFPRAAPLHRLFRRPRKAAAMKISFARPADPKGRDPGRRRAGGRSADARRAVAGRGHWRPGRPSGQGGAALRRQGGEAAAMPAPANLPVDSVLLIGLVRGGGAGCPQGQRVGAELYSRLAASGETTATVQESTASTAARWMPPPARRSRPAPCCGATASTMYRTTEKDDAKARPEDAGVPAGRPRAAKKAFDAAQAVDRGRVPDPRPVLRTPPTSCTRRPLRSAAGSWRRWASRSRCSAARSWRSLGMGALLAVGQGSQHEQPARRHALERRQGEGGAGRLRRQGRDLRYRRHLAGSRRPAWAT